MIIVNDKYALRSDGTSWSACERLTRPVNAKDGKGGEEYYRAVGYGSTVTEVLKCLAKRMIREVGMGEDRLSLGDYIIRGTQGEYSVCKPDTFRMIYEPVEQ